MEKPKVFISHISEEARLANIFKECLLKDFLEMIDVFVSSDNVSISVGSKWLNDVDKALKTAQVELILCSTESVKRPWVNFEAGAGWVKGIPIVPVCHTGMRPVDLPIPLNMLQAVEANSSTGLEKIYVLLAKQLGSTTPSIDFDKIISEVRTFEQEYGVIRVAAHAVKAIIKLLPELEQIFRPSPTHRSASGDVSDIKLDKMQVHLDTLQSMHMIDYATGSNKFVAGPAGGGNLIELKIQVHDDYYKVASKVMA